MQRHVALGLARPDHWPGPGAAPRMMVATAAHMPFWASRRSMASRSHSRSRSWLRKKLPMSSCAGPDSSFKLPSLAARQQPPAAPVASGAACLAGGTGHCCVGSAWGSGGFDACTTCRWGRQDSSQGRCLGHRWPSGSSGRCIGSSSRAGLSSWRTRWRACLRPLLLRLLLLRLLPQLELHHL